MVRKSSCWFRRFGDDGGEKKWKAMGEERRGRQKVELPNNGEATGKGSCAYWLLLGLPVKAAKSRDVVLMP